MSQKVVRHPKSAVIKAMRLIDYVQSFSLFLGVLAVITTFIYLLFAHI